MADPAPAEKRLGISMDLPKVGCLPSWDATWWFNTVVATTATIVTNVYKWNDLRLRLASQLAATGATNGSETSMILITITELSNDVADKLRSDNARITAQEKCRETGMSRNDSECIGCGGDKRWLIRGR